MVLVGLLLGAAMLARCCVASDLPDRACTPGAVATTDTHVICGTSTRARRNVPDAVRRERFASYGISWNDRSRYELDHLVPLELGGSNAASNLWPEPLADAERKDQVENALHRRVCSGAMALEAAQRVFENDWTKGIR